MKFTGLLAKIGRWGVQTKPKPVEADALGLGAKLQGKPKPEEKLRPPRLWEIDGSLLLPFTMNGRVPISHMYLDNKPGTSRRLRISAEKYGEVFHQLETRSFIYYGKSMDFFYEAFKDFPLAGQRVIVWGLAGCNCEAMALWQKAASVHVVDYNPPVCEHPGIEVISHDELAASTLTFDCAFSFSSFEHAGLGRYGDPIGPDLDLDAMRTAKKYLRKGGRLFFGAPLGQDCLVWNAHRIYGPQRLPLLLKGWRVLACYPPFAGCFELPLGKHAQPLLILENTDEEYAGEGLGRGEGRSAGNRPLRDRIQEML